MRIHWIRGVVLAAAFSIVLIFSWGMTSAEYVSNGKDHDFTLRDLSGDNVSLSEHRGKVVVLDFWASWCLPCRVAIPELVQIQDRYREKGLVVLGISLDDPESVSNEDLRAFKERFGVNYRILRHDHQVVRDFFQGRSTQIPTAVIIDRKGRVQERITGFRPGALEESLIRILDM